MILSKSIAHVVGTVLAVTVSCGCGSQPQTAPRTHEVEISGFVFVPETVSIKPGDTITWTNRDIAPHTATANDDSWDTGAINQDESKSVLFTAEMASSYVCLFHPAMKGAVDVTTN